VRAERNGRRLGGARGYSREVILVVCLLYLIGLFALTAFATRMYHKRVHTLADQWFAQGEADVKAGEAKKALTDYRNALVFSPSNSVFQFHLAQALAANGEWQEARAYLLSLLSESPGSGETNLALARIAAKQSKPADAMMFYNGAIYGEWDDNPIERRWEVRKELCEYLLHNGAASQAEPALIALADSTPEGDVEKRKIVGELLLQGQMWNQALDEFRAVLAANREDRDALEGAGMAAYNLGEYSEAAGFLGRLPEEIAADPKISSRLETARMIDAEDPSVLGLPTREKARRAANALKIAIIRAQACAGDTHLSSVDRAQLSSLLATGQKQSKDWSELNLTRDPDRINEAMSLVFQIEDRTYPSCGEPNAEDRGLWMIANKPVSSRP
jgi:tetratricopeptide (TPR) repeat protein